MEYLDRLTFQLIFQVYTVNHIVIICTRTIYAVGDSNIVAFIVQNERQLGILFHSIHIAITIKNECFPFRTLIRFMFENFRSIEESI